MLLLTEYQGVQTRPAPSLLEASKSYIAVRGQLSLQLPKYLQLLQKGITPY
jgi:dynamin-binding protein